MIEKKSIRIESNGLEKISVDLANILYNDRDEKGKLKAENIIKLYNSLREENYDPYLILDAPLRYKVDNELEYERLVEEQILYQAPAGRKADNFFLNIAKAFKCKFLTNDLCREYYDEFGKDWIQENRKTFMFIDGKLILEKFNKRKE